MDLLNGDEKILKTKTIPTVKIEYKGKIDFSNI